MPVNIGNPDEISLKEFAEEVLELTGKKARPDEPVGRVKIIYQPLPVDDPKQRQPDISKAISILGWQPKVHRRDGLKTTYEYFKSLSADEWNKLPKEFISNK